MSLAAITEVAVCQCGAGMARREDFTVLEIAGRPLTVAAHVRRVAGRRLRAGTTFAGGLWWRPVAPHRVLVAGPRAAVGDAPDLTVRDVSNRYAVIALAGPRAAELALRATGAAAVSGARPVVITPAERAGELWCALGAMPVSPAAIDLQWAGQRIVECQRPAGPRSVIRR